MIAPCPGGPRIQNVSPRRESVAAAYATFAIVSKRTSMRATARIMHESPVGRLAPRLQIRCSFLLHRSNTKMGRKG